MSLNKFTSITLSLIEFSLLWDVKNLNFMKSRDQVKMLDIPCVLLSATPWTEAHRLLSPWDSPGKNTGVGCHALLQGTFWTQGLNSGLLTQADSLPPKSPEKMRRGVQSQLKDSGFKSRCELHGFIKWTWAFLHNSGALFSCFPQMKSLLPVPAGSFQRVLYIQFSRSVMSGSLWPHEPQHARPPCPSPTPGVHPNPCPLSRWSHPTISSSVVPFSSCPQSFPASGSFQMSQLFASGGQNIGVSASTSVLPMNTQDWSPLGWTGWTSLQSKGLSRIFSIH